MGARERGSEPDQRVDGTRTTRAHQPALGLGAVVARFKVLLELKQLLPLELRVIAPGVREKRVHTACIGLLGALVQLGGVGADRDVGLDVLVGEGRDADAAHLLIRGAQRCDRVAADHSGDDRRGGGAARGGAAAGKVSLDAPAHLQGNSGL